MRERGGEVVESERGRCLCNGKGGECVDQRLWKVHVHVYVHVHSTYTCTCTCMIWSEGCLLYMYVHTTLSDSRQAQPLWGALGHML